MRQMSIAGQEHETGEKMDVQVEAILQGAAFKKLLEEEFAEFRQKYDLKRAEIEILYFLSKCGENNTSTDIHSQLMMNKGHISQAVDNLCKRNLISAKPDSNDRRYVHFEIQECALEIVSEIIERRERMNALIREGISEEEMAVFRKVSAQIRKNIEKIV